MVDLLNDAFEQLNDTSFAIDNRFRFSRVAGLPQDTRVLSCRCSPADQVVKLQIQMPTVGVRFEALCGRLRHVLGAKQNK